MVHIGRLGGGAMTDSETRRIEIDPDERPIFDIDHCDEPDDEEGSRGGALRREGVTIPFELAEFGNGKLPDEVLVPIGIYRHRLHGSAAAAFQRLREAAAGAGIDLTCTDTYRPYEEQVDLKRRKPSLAATPGKSVHGWGCAVDVSIGLPPKAFGNSVYQWLVENAPNYDWHLGRPKDEPWHWVYRGPIDPTVPEAVSPDEHGHRTEQESTSQSEQLPRGWKLAPATVAGLLGVSDSDADALDAAIRAFQGDQGLLVDGIVGPVTTRTLWATTVPEERPETSVGARGDTVRWIQLRVGATPDGRFGPETLAAVKRFQAAAGLATDGVVGPRTWNALTTAG